MFVDKIGACLGLSAGPNGDPLGGLLVPKNPCQGQNLFFLSGYAESFNQIACANCETKTRFVSDNDLV